MRSALEARRIGGSESADALLGFVTTQLAEVRAQELEARTGEDPEAVHEMRVAVRRLRSVLRTSRPLLDERWVTDVRGELSWLGSLLGAVRDLDVLVAHLRSEANGLSGGDAALIANLTRPLRLDHARARDQLVEALDGQRYQRLLALVESADGAVVAPRRSVTVGELAAKEFERLDKRGKPSRGASNAALHKRRIRTKRARYAAEFAGSRANGFIERAKTVQDLLGEHQDAVVATRRLRQIAHQAGRADVALVAGRLIERESTRARKVRKQIPVEWKRLRKSGRKTWHAS